MKSPLPAPRYDAVAGWFRSLERLAFGRSLERARRAGLAGLAEPGHALLLGEGDGRFLVELRRAFPGARVDCVDASARMLALARSRLESAHGDRQGVRFVQADVLREDLPARGYDVVVTNFFLDCFDEEGIRLVVRCVTRAVAPGARWLVADFAPPRRGVAGFRSRAWLALLYAFFGRVAAQPVRRLVAPAPFLRAAGWRSEREATFRLGLVRASRYRFDRSPELPPGSSR